jgi:hypothetical protein
MMSIRLGAVALIAAATAALGGCASEPQAQSQQAAADRNPCIGVAPATGSMVRRKEDCGGAAAAQRDANTQEMIEQIRNSQGIGRSVVKP